MKVIVYTFYQPYLARVVNFIWIFIAQLYRRANESTFCTFYQPYLTMVSNCIWISIVRLYRNVNLKDTSKKLFLKNIAEKSQDR